MRDAQMRTFSGLLFLITATSLSACGDTGTSTRGANGATANGGNGGTAAAGAGMTNGGGGVGATGGTGGTGGTTTGSGTGAAMLVEAGCDNHVYECGDTLDNDGDGLGDWEDPDCLGPCDNTEDSFFGGIPGQEGPACIVDCYWDSNSGPGNDECYWSHECDPNEIDDPGHPEPNSKCPYNENANIPGSGKSCDELKQAQSATCAAVCGPLTPNGCDCFGCCELPAGGGKYVWAGSIDEATKLGSCTIADLADPNKCEPCIPVPSCLNECGKCELCIGKSPEDIPPECNPGSGGAGGTGGGTGGTGGGTGGSGGGSNQCPAGIQPCGLPGQALCGDGFYCITGCCQPIVEPQ